ncbi:hypothetical protein SeLEV6574_g05383 [Synchytrium endobioticum]|uniref:Uncharacterized protein n=1 Tax=Synchytrium endobioticum TaxID=286115 RepID=A0A507CUP8_9FUNG|nr:hypothetical protein SeLEV6574_g05383 [Synchytrium endobioticum]
MVFGIWLMHAQAQHAATTPNALSGQSGFALKLSDAVVLGSVGAAYHWKMQHHKAHPLLSIHLPIEPSEHRTGIPPASESGRAASHPNQRSSAYQPGQYTKQTTNCTNTADKGRTASCPPSPAAVPPDTSNIMVEDSICVSDSVSRYARREADDDGDDEGQEGCEGDVNRLMDLVHEALGIVKAGARGTADEEDEEVMLLNKITEVLNVGPCPMATKVDHTTAPFSNDVAVDRCVFARLSLTTPSQRHDEHGEPSAPRPPPHSHAPLIPPSRVAPRPDRPVIPLAANQFIGNHSASSDDIPSKPSPSPSTPSQVHLQAQRKSLFPPPPPILDLPKIEYESFATDDDTFLERAILPLYAKYVPKLQSAAKKTTKPDKDGNQRKPSNHTLVCSSTLSSRLSYASLEHLRQHGIDGAGQPSIDNTSRLQPLQNENRNIPSGRTEGTTRILDIERIRRMPKLR